MLYVAPTWEEEKMLQLRFQTTKLIIFVKKEILTSTLGLLYTWTVGCHKLVWGVNALA